MLGYIYGIFLLIIQRGYQKFTSVCPLKTHRLSPSASGQCDPRAPRPRKMLPGIYLHSSPPMASPEGEKDRCRLTVKTPPDFPLHEPPPCSSFAQPSMSILLTTADSNVTAPAYVQNQLLQTNPPYCNSTLTYYNYSSAPPNRARRGKSAQRASSASHLYISPVAPFAACARVLTAPPARNNSRRQPTQRRSACTIISTVLGFTRFQSSQPSTRSTSGCIHSSSSARGSARARCGAQRSRRQPRAE